MNKRINESHYLIGYNDMVLKFHQIIGRLPGEYDGWQTPLSSVSLSCAHFQSSEPSGSASVYYNENKITAQRLTQNEHMKETENNSKLSHM